MSNTKKPNGKQFSLERYRSEIKGSPFELYVTDDDVITISRPTGDQVLDAEAAMREGDSREVIRALCGDQAERILELVGAEDAAVLKAFSQDLQEHFQTGE